jgi:hypothetical protein
VLAKKKIGLATASATDGEPDDLQNIQRLSRCAVPAGTALGRAVRPGNALILHPLAYPQLVGVNGHNPARQNFSAESLALSVSKGKADMTFCEVRFRGRY